MDKALTTKLRKEILKNMRGKRSSLQLSRQMDYKFNQVDRWEIGEKIIRWDEFSRYCRLLKIPLLEVFYRDLGLLPIDATWNELETKIFWHLRKHMPLRTQREIAESLDCSLSGFKRFMNGNVVPSLDVILVFLDQVGLLPHFLMALFPGSESPLIKSLTSEDDLLRDAEIQNPFACAVEVGLATKEYVEAVFHDENVLAQKAGCTPEVVRIVLEKMCAENTIFRDESGKYHLKYNKVNTQGARMSDVVRFIRFWWNRSLDRFQENEIVAPSGVKGATFYRITAVSKPCAAKINDILARCNSEIVQTAEDDSEPMTEVRIILMQAFNANDVRPLDRSAHEKLSRDSKILKIK